VVFRPRPELDSIEAVSPSRPDCLFGTHLAFSSLARRVWLFSFFSTYPPLQTTTTSTICFFAFCPFGFKKE
jgi:hypothetical protein